MTDNNPVFEKTVFIIDETSFVALYNQYWQEALTLARQLLQDDCAAEDIVQNIFISLWKRRAELRITQPIAHYLKRAVKFAAAAYIRDQSRKETISIHTFTPIAAGHTDAALLHKELVCTVNNFVEQLPAQNQKVYQLRFHHALDNPKIAHLLGMSEKTVRNQLSLALKRIRTLLVKEGY
ncbi:RNA polymerase sigma factor [Chitinophaga nivalis]|uniref:Sigma-70 family RNA polymerase sigma factor n=1 Tax=Chitinophaga nivalis TaxID=2991709 RepID=A0ABT3IMB7_9BACT|nr:sigma-70 family RNA polymerase sigma factor [Chitinophaga nivalis]MCW3485119.1 sigma-70 family RNA polymerase sigma factor [Chitinophaga nivalis]